MGAGDDTTRLRRLRILFVCGSDFNGPSEKQVLWAARELTRRGHHVAISLRGDPSTAASEGADRISGLNLIWHSFSPRGVRRRDKDAAAHFQPDLIHAWTARHPTITVAKDYRDATGAPVFVHWEDDEWGLMAGLPGRSAPRKVVHAARKLARPMAPGAWYFATPWSLRWSVREAAAFDALAPSLAKEVETRTGRRCELVFPISPAAAESPEPTPEATLKRLGARPTVLYTGDVNYGREGDVRICIQAIGILRAQGHQVTFAHAGRNSSRFDFASEARMAGLEAGDVIELGVLPFGEIPGLLQRATVLAQPGRPTSHNRLGLPSKLQAYLASGTPVVTFAFGSGELFEDRKEVLKTYTSEPEELAARIAEVITDQELRATLATHSPQAAKRLFDPARNGDKLLAHYAANLSHGSAV